MTWNDTKNKQWRQRTILEKDCEMSDDDAVKKGVVHFCRKNWQKIVFLLLPASSFGRSGNKFPAIKSISNTALDTTICLVAHFSKAVGTGDTRGQLPPPPLYFDRLKTCYMKLPYKIPCQPRCSNLCSFTPYFGRNSDEEQRLIYRIN